MFYYGIDLGTTYSCIARADENGAVEVIKNIEGKNITPSVVEFISSTEIVVGETAKGDAILAPDNVSLYIKRSMGKKDEFLFHGEKYKPEQISAFILKKLVSDASSLTGEEITDVVISVPAYFGFDEKQATENAGRIAGLNVLAIVNEPTAAAIAYGAKSKAKEDKIVLVYDLGGGTFDITVAEIVGDRVTVISTEGNHTLGGKDWDAELISYFVSQFCEKTGVDEERVYDDTEVLNELVIKTEEAKKELSAKNSTAFSLSLGREQRAKLEVSVDKFDEITRHHLSSTIELTKVAIKQAATKTSSTGKSCDKFDEIILVGGSTRMRQVKEALKKEFGIEPKLFEPDEAVARGAALLAQYLVTNPPAQTAVGGIARKSERFEEVTSKSYGIETIDKQKSVLSHVILKNDKIPLSNTETYYTLESNQWAVELKIYESNIMEPITDLSFGKLIAENELKLPPDLPADSPLDVTFSLDRNGLLCITAVERSRGGSCNITVKTAGLQESEILRLRSATSAIKVTEEA
jgi:molecular chaperone DnaK (HSP70)